MTLLRWKHGYLSNASVIQKEGVMEFEERLRDRQWSIKDGCSVAKLLDLLST